MSDKPVPDQPTSNHDNAETQASLLPPSDIITFDEFMKVKLRVARILEASEHPNADKLLVLKVDLGNEQRQIVAGIKGYYAPEDLVDKNIVVCVNLAPRMMRGEQSQGMLLAASSEDRSKVILLTPDEEIEPGAGIS